MPLTSKCKICNTNLNSFMSFGKMPIANGFISKKDFVNEYFYKADGKAAERFCKIILEITNQT